MKKLTLTLLPMMALPAWAGDIELNIKSHCTIEVHGKKLVNTICNMLVSFPDYICVGCIPDDNFPIKLPRYFVSIGSIHQGGNALLGTASWNEEPGATHAQSELGEIRYVGSYCWANDTIKVCAIPTVPRR